MKNTYLQRFRVSLLFSVILMLSSLNLNAQKPSDTLVKQNREFKNTIHFNITNPLIFGDQSIIFGYERVLKHNQTFSINIGRASIRSFGLLDGDELKVKSSLSNGGFHISADYRFYLSKLNKYHAPRGVYIGPYYSYNNFEKGHSWEFTPDITDIPQTIDSKLNIDIHTVGFELGYQFVFWKRFSVDMILLGPGVATYNLKAELGGNLSEEDKQLFYEKLNEALKDKFPGYSNINVDGDFQKKGSANTTSFGYRYMIQIGYRF